MNASQTIYQTFTKREKEIAKYISYGLNIEEIAKKLCIAPTTVATHRNNIYTKLFHITNKDEKCSKSLISLVYWKNNLEELKMLDIENIR